MSRKLLYIFLSLLIVLNLVLLTLIILKTDKRTMPKDIFLVEALKLNSFQQEKFRVLDADHRKEMRSIDKDIMKLKDDFFQSFSNPTFDPESHSKLLGALEAKKDLEIYRFFGEVRKLCSPEQQRRFDEVISKALKRGRKGPPPRLHQPKFH